MKIKLPESIARVASNLAFKAKKASPEIAIILGVTGVIAGTILACRAAVKGTEVVKEHKEAIEKAESLKNEAGEETDEYKKEVVKTYIHTGIKLGKVFGPAVACEVSGIGLVLCSHHILKDRTAALSAAYMSLDKGFKKYKERVTEKVGEEEEKKLRYGIKKETVEIPFINDDGEPVTETKEMDTTDGLEYSPYARFFDELSDEFDEKNKEYNLTFLRSVEKECTWLLKRNGHLFLNEVYDMLGLRRSKEGQAIGWVYDEKKGENRVSFGIYDVHKPANRAFVNGWEEAILLDFNVDGNILDRI